MGEVSDVLGILAFSGLIIGLLVGLRRQIRYMSMLERTQAPDQKLLRKNRLVAASMGAFIFFFAMNVLTGTGMVTETYVSNRGTALGAWISLIIFLLAKFAMRPKNPPMSIR
ncbi:hypothetical protein [Bhargavaea cecembensis]|uniref:hypothetical protein n=1 Tax=Bhargavaea cecembensis TaxID=394098 RepID=UPI000590A0D0|nr:hypothetical protein [Bhargavaea cecembensis]